MIEVHELTKTFPDLTAVDRISFSVEEGESLILLGTSGCGKTTTLRMINRLLEPTDGRIRINGQDILKLRATELRRRIGYVIQNVGLFPHYSVEQNIGVVPRLLKWEPARIRRRVSELLDLMGLPFGQFAGRYPEELSGGQQQRVGLARALAADPPVVLLDEPFGALDLITRQQIQKEFKKLESILHKTMILVTHDIFEAFELGDRICLMDKGRIQQIGTGKELVLSPRNAFVSSFIAEHRFRLELKVFCLRDIRPFLESRSAEDGEVMESSPDDTLLDVLESVEKENGEKTTIRIRGDSEAGPVEAAPEAVLNAFYRMKESGEG